MLNRKRSAESLDYDLPKNCRFCRYESGWLLEWNEEPCHILVVRKKVENDSVDRAFEKIIKWLLKKTSAVVYVESDYFQLVTKKLSSSSLSTKLSDHIVLFDNDKRYQIDLILTLGGDGTLLNASGYFKHNCPPIMAFNLGTIGFMAPFCFQKFKECLPKVIKGSVPCILRNRLCFSIHKLCNDKGEMSNCNSDSLRLENLALNDIVIDRGSSNHMLKLIITVDKKFLTKTYGDGLIISTPTGSTAYSLAAGASIIHPSVRAVLITPINPYSLSMRPILLPVGVDIMIAIDKDGREDSAHISFDGNNRQFQINRTECVNICVSRYPVISVCRSDQMVDWFEGLNTCLNWNRKNESLLKHSDSSE